MDESEFERISGEALANIEAMLETNDIDFEWLGDVLEIDLGAAGKAVINRHRPTQEIWLASRKGAAHYRHVGSCWCDTRNGLELLAGLSVLIDHSSI